MTRLEHLERCKKRAFAYLDEGDITQAYTSMTSDMKKHPETANHAAIELGMMLMMTGKLSTVPEMKKLINGFN